MRDVRVTPTLWGLRRGWSRLAPITVEQMEGDWEASFVRPLCTVAPIGLGLIGLRRWYGKRFVGDAGVNLVWREGALRDTMPMRLTQGWSRIDGGVALMVTYPPRGPRPWRWVRDELRLAPDGTVVGMTVIDLPGLRRLGTPFLLSRPQSDVAGP